MLKTQDLEVELQSGQMQKLVATKGVDMTQKPDRKGHGDRLDYDPVTEDIVLTGTSGSEAEIHRGDDSDKGCKITIRKNGSRSTENCINRGVESAVKGNKK